LDNDVQHPRIGKPPYVTYIHFDFENITVILDPENTNIDLDPNFKIKEFGFSYHTGKKEGTKWKFGEIKKNPNGIDPYLKKFISDDTEIIIGETERRDSSWGWIKKDGTVTPVTIIFVT
jgi:hypothetical protein